MSRREHPIPVSDVRPGLSERQRLRKQRYLLLMGLCVTLIVLAWTVVRFFSVPLAIAMSVVAAVIPPFAAIIANPVRDVRIGSAGNAVRPSCGSEGLRESGSQGVDPGRYR